MVDPINCSRDFTSQTKTKIYACFQQNSEVRFKPNIFVLYSKIKLKLTGNNLEEEVSLSLIKVVSESKMKMLEFIYTLPNKGNSSIPLFKTRRNVEYIAIC